MIVYELDNDINKLTSNEFVMKTEESKIYGVNLRLFEYNLLLSFFLRKFRLEDLVLWSIQTDMVYWKL